MAEEEYVELLEKVNQQISYTWNPINATLFILSLLITFGAIVTAVLIYLQSRDFKKRCDEMFKNIQKQNNKLINSAKDKLDQYDKTLNQAVAEGRKELDKIKKGKITSSTIKRLEQKIEELERLKSEKDNLAISSSLDLDPKYLTFGGQFPSFSNNIHGNVSDVWKCKNCGAINSGLNKSCYNCTSQFLR